MSQDVKTLIDKIQKEGLGAAQAKEEEILKKARQEAERIIHNAKKEAETLTQNAREHIAREEEKKKALLAQASRDMILKLKEELLAMLERLVRSEVAGLLDREALERILEHLIEKSTHAHVKVLLPASEEGALKKHFIHKLKDDVKKGVVFQSTGALSGGFMISYDEGKSYFDFSQNALAEFIAQNLKPELNDILGGLKG